MTRTRPALIALTAALTLGVAACGSDDSPEESETSSAAETSSETSTSAETTSGETSAGDTESTSSGGAASDDQGAQAVLEAIAAAEKEADGTAYEIDDQEDDGTWEVDVAKGSESIEVEVAEDGSTTADESDDLDEDDRAGVRAAKIEIGDAITAALEEVEGTLDDVELEEEDGAHYWEVTIDSADRDDVEVRVDVTDGTAKATSDDNDDTDDTNDTDDD